MTARRAVFLDRDGTLTTTLLRDRRPVAPSDVGEFELLPDVAEAARQLHAAGFALIVVTNQPDVRTGTTRIEAVEEMNRRLREWLPLDDILVCYHVEADSCECRKPKPGMLLMAAGEHGINLDMSWMVGDRWRDVSAGKAAGCRTIFLDRGYAESLRDAADFTVKSFSEAAEMILNVPA